MPRGRGRKGSKAPTKRKAAVPVQERIELHPISTGKDAASLHASMQIQVSACSDTEVSVSPVCNSPSFYGHGTTRGFLIHHITALQRCFHPHIHPCLHQHIFHQP